MTPIERDWIDVGDIVSIILPTCPMEDNVEVLHRPSATGDCWRLRREDGTLVNVMIFEKMVRTREASHE